MKNFWDRRLLPYQGGGSIIFTSQDEYGRLLVIDDGERRMLNFDSQFEQSAMCVHRPYQLVHQYTQLMALVLAYIEPAHISLFGLGGGSLLRAFHHVLPDCQFHAIELRKNVVDIAREFFFVPDDHRVDITVGDAVKEISTLDDNSSDIIFSDMYDAYQMVPTQTQNSFLRDCSRILTSRGWMIINLYHLPANRAEFFKLLHSVFPTVMLSTSDENSVLLVSKAAPERVCTDIQRLTAIDFMLQQRISQYLPRLKPVSS